MSVTIEKNNNLEEVPFEYYLQQYHQADPEEIALRTGIPYDKALQSFTLTFLQRQYSVTWPEYHIHCIDQTEGYAPLEDMAKAQILAIRFLLEHVPHPFKGTFLSYRDIPSGEVYYRQFNGRCMQRLAFSFGTKPERYCRALELLRAEKIASSDHGYQFEIFPGYAVQFLLWEADEEFPPSTQILFADNVSAAFHSEDLVVMSEIAISAMKKVLG